MQSHLMTTAEACVALDVSYSTLKRMIRDGVLPQPRRIHNFRQRYFLRQEFLKACRKALR
jgi:excisionase family DNA binding protein